ncbi:hypothetical protein quinque_008078 [Culex quinquefasciatus]
MRSPSANTRWSRRPRIGAGADRCGRKKLLYAASLAKFPAAVSVAVPAKSGRKKATVCCGKFNEGDRD